MPEQSALFETAKIRRDANFDPTRVYRYQLFRVWDRAMPRVAFVMLNPSIADTERDDPTVARCIKFAMRWGFGSLEVLNLFALVATNPAALLKHEDPVGPDNDAVIETRALDREHIAKFIVAWGAHGAIRGRGTKVAAILRRSRDLYCLRSSPKTGEPWHPLYLPGDLDPIPYTR